MLGASFAVGQAVFSFGKGFSTQGFKVAESGFSPKGFAEKYGPLRAIDSRLRQMEWSTGG
jgi:hypothetical protein